jgi:hypothetical protein
LNEIVLWSISPHAQQITKTSSRDIKSPVETSLGKR